MIGFKNKIKDALIVQPSYSIMLAKKNLKKKVTQNGLFELYCLIIPCIIKYEQIRALIFIIYNYKRP